MSQKEEWMSVYRYAKLKGCSKSNIYHQIKKGIIPKDKVRKVIIELERIQIKVDKTFDAKKG